MAYAIVSTVKPNANDTPSRPIPTLGKEAASTALPQPPNTSQNVPIDSATMGLASITVIPPASESRKEQRGCRQSHRKRRDAGTGFTATRAATAESSWLLQGFLDAPGALAVLTASAASKRHAPCSIPIWSSQTTRGRVRREWIMERAMD